MKLKVRRFLLNLKCFFGFHDYQPINGIYWEHLVQTYSYYPPSVMGIYLIKVYKCPKCGKVYEKIIETYDKDIIDVNNIASRFADAGIKHIAYYYDDE